MSQSESPVRALFDVQRTAIKQSQQAIKQGLAVQRSTDKLTKNTLKAQESVQRQGLELAQATAHSYFGAAAAFASAGQSGGQQIHSEAQQGSPTQAIDQTFAQLKETHSEFYDTLERELDRGIDSFDDLSEEYVEALDEQVDGLMESTRTVEDQTTENVSEFSQSLHEQLERTQEIQEQLEEEFERQTQQAEQLLERQAEQAEQFQQDLEEEAERMQRQLRAQSRDAGTVGGAAADAGTDTRDVESELELIEGLDSTYAERLEDAGITSIEDLVDADSQRVASVAEVSQDRAVQWIQQAEA
ncbi:helix-hairpin-helix domain-containing protein [Natrialbaceae archaeon GCM10025810]|uniref:helix-hairpin-helix domain-containing protein n=1 Tax=Halovalidus salilacus TaxID=3075124 RepID=UPI003619C410